MTDNIQKLYEVAGVPRIYSEFNNGKETVVENVFSPYKQLELIKWLATKQEKFTILYDSDYGYTCEVVNINNCYESFSYYEPIQALCNLTIGLWNDLSDEQREEVKRILQ